MERIIVCDDFLSNEELNKANEIIQNGLWKYGHHSLGTKLYEDDFWSMDLTQNDFFSKYLLSIIEKHFSKKFILQRVYANGHTFGQDGHFHTDSENTNDYTFCFYFTKIEDSYVETAGGYLYFNLPDVKYKIAFEPIYNRGIMFPSNYVHKGTCFSRYVMDMRISIAWKLTEIIDS
jgi:hypothetical protein